LVVRLSGAYAEYSRVLGDVDFNLQQMLSSADKFNAYLDERLLWVPSAPVISDHYLKDSFHSLLWLMNPNNWIKLVANLWQGLNAYPLVISVILAIVGLHWRFRRVIKARLLSRLQKSSNNPYAISFSQIVHSMSEVLLLTLPVPLMMVWTAWVLRLNRGADAFSLAFVDGVLAAAVSLGVMQFFYRVFKPGGIAELLFLWEHRTVELLYGQLQWSRFVVIPCIFIVAMTGNDLFSEHSYALGRTALILMMLTLAYVLHRLCHPDRGLAKGFYRFSHSWLSRLRYVWYAIAVLGPLVIIGFAVAGYYQSALELQEKLITTLRLFVGTALFHALALRWLAVTKRQLALQNARNKRKQIDQPVAVEGVHLPDENLHDLSKISQQSNKLLTTVISAILAVGFWMIWSEILPAFSVFERFELWQHVQMQDGKEILQPITLINIMICLLYAGLALVFVSNFPALVDLLSVGKYAMTAGSRYALIQLVRYTLVSIAFLAIANELGGSWSQVQWLVAALSVGLGFGLQEIFANMVSGIILLFERPIRVGDTVTVGNVTGRVSHIQMRATHIVDWDRKELIVPNKTFITDQLINWTLSDTVTRVVVPIGVAYGSDADMVETLLNEAIKNTELVLQDPEPTVNFVGFGESSLDFKVNVYVKELSDRLPVANHLHKAIYSLLTRHHIEIPYPQRDVHIRSVAEGILPSK
jgi:potassium-dependent mechanosensitive channel